MTTLRIASLMMVLLAGAVSAAESGSKAVSVDIDAVPLGVALHRLAEQTNLQFVFYSEIAQGVTAPRVVGILTPEDALARILANTGLRYQYLDEHTVAIRAAKDAEKSSAAQRLSEGAEVQVAQGQSPQSSSPSSTAGEGAQRGDEEKSKIEEVIVTAQKREERLKDVPISISVMNGADLDQSTVQGVTEALSRIPGVAVNTAGLNNGTLLTVRGVTSGGALFVGSSPVAYYLDGMPFGLTRSSILPDANAYDLDRVEVLRGPQGTLYGASTLSGVMRVLTKDADLHTFEFKARTSLSSTDDGGDSYRGDAAVNVPIVEDKLAVRGVIGYQNLGGWIDTPLGKDTNDAELRSYRLKLNAQPTDMLSIGLSAWRSNDDIGGLSDSRYDRTTIQTKLLPVTTDFSTYGLKISYEFPLFSVSSMSSYLKYDSTGTFDFGSGVILATDLNSKVFSEEFLVRSTHESSWRWSLAGTIGNAKDRALQAAPLLWSTPIDFSDTSKSEAVFGELSWRFFNDRLKWTLGLRHFHDAVGSNEDEDFFHIGSLASKRGEYSSTTPRAVLTWFPDTELTVYGSYSQGFRSGFPQDFLITVFAPNFPDLKPDRLSNYEVGAKGNLLNGRLSLDAALYYMDWRDVQQPLSVPYNGIEYTAPINGTSASGLGVDVAMAIRPLDGLSLGLTLSWNDLTWDTDVNSGGVLLYHKGDRLDQSPERTIGAFAEYAVALGGSGFTGRISTSANYTSEQKVTDVNGLSSYGNSILIARTSFAIEAPAHWSATFFVDNLNNERGAIVPDAYDPDLQPRVRPRTIGVQLDYRFK